MLHRRRARSPSARDIGEVGAGAAAVFEQARFADPQIHNAAFAHQIIAHGLNEAGVRLRVLIGAFGAWSACRFLEIHIVVTLTGPSMP